MYVYKCHAAHELFSFILLNNEGIADDDDDDDDDDSLWYIYEQMKQKLSIPWFTDNILYSLNKLLDIHASVIHSYSQAKKLGFLGIKKLVSR